VISVGLTICLQATLLFAEWTLSGDMNYVRQDHSSTLLNNGKVLITGWNSNIAELYDPGSGTFTVTGSTNANHRQGFTATLLNSGKVLIAGGLNALRVAELYDPATGTFSLTDSLKNVHEYHTATLLPDGKVLIAGGQDQVGPQTHAVAEIYDPVSGTFSVTGSLKEHRSAHTATLLPDGKVLIAGGLQTTTPGNAKGLKECELYDPAAGSFTLTQSLISTRYEHSSTLLGTGKVLVAGGSLSTNVCELYDNASHTWTSTGPMTVAGRQYHTATQLSDGRVVLAGGRGGNLTSTAEIYDPAANAFNPLDSMTTVRTEHCASLLASGSVLVTGGYNGTAAVKSAELLTVQPAAVAQDELPNDRQQIPKAFFLAQNYPNPFNPSTFIKFELPIMSHVILKVYDMLGREVSALVNESRRAGIHEVRFDRHGLTSGVYFYRLEAGTFVQTKRLLLLR
jgi:WD40 repeat protein